MGVGGTHLKTRTYHSPASLISPLALALSLCLGAPLELPVTRPPGRPAPAPPRPARPGVPPLPRTARAVRHVFGSLFALSYSSSEAGSPARCSPSSPTLSVPPPSLGFHSSHTPAFSLSSPSPVPFPSPVLPLTSIAAVPPSRILAPLLCFGGLKLRRGQLGSGDQKWTDVVVSWRLGLFCGRV